MLLFAESPPLGGGRTCSHHTPTPLLFVIPRAAILRGGAWSGTFHPNGCRRKDMTITADSFRFGLRAGCPARLPSAVRQIPVTRDALPLSPLRLTEFWPHVAQRSPIPQSPNPPQGTSFGAYRVAGFYLFRWFFCL